MADVFISYAQEDRQIASELAKHLSGAGYSVWWDSQIAGGSRFRETIASELLIARCVLVIWSQHSIHSHFVEDEAERARSAGKLIPLRTDDLDIAKIPLGFGGYQIGRTKEINYIVDAMRALGITPSEALSTPKWQTNMFTFNAEDGGFRDGIKFSLIRLHNDARVSPAVDLRDWPDVYRQTSPSRNEVNLQDNPHLIFIDPTDPPAIADNLVFRGGVKLVPRNDDNWTYRITKADDPNIQLVRVDSGRSPHNEALITGPHGAFGMDAQPSIAGFSAAHEIVRRRSSLWRMPIGSTVLVKPCSDSLLFRIVSTRAGVRVVDAIGYEEVFEHLIAAT